MAPTKINILQSVDRQIEKVFDVHLISDVNGSQVKVAKFGVAVEWHAHPDEDGAFLVLRGRVAFDFRDKTVEIGEGEILVVNRGIEHRARALTHEPVVLIFEPTSIMKPSDPISNLAVANLKRLT